MKNPIVIKVEMNRDAVELLAGLQCDNESLLNLSKACATALNPTAEALQNNPS